MFPFIFSHLVKNGIQKECSLFYFVSKIGIHFHPSPLRGSVLEHFTLVCCEKNFFFRSSFFLSVYTTRDLSSYPITFHSLFYSLILIFRNYFNLACLILLNTFRNRKKSNVEGNFQVVNFTLMSSKVSS